MALKLNVFKTITEVVPASPTIIYTSPVGYSGIILFLQVTNTSTNTPYDVTISHQRGAVITEICKNFPISSNDTASLLNGKMVFESGDQLIISGSNGSNLKLIASILETLN